MTINLPAKNRKRAKRDQLKYALNYRVIADGRDLTNQCFYYDGRRRIVGVNLLDEKGQFYLTERQAGDCTAVHQGAAGSIGEEGRVRGSLGRFLNSISA